MPITETFAFTSTISILFYMFLHCRNVNHKTCPICRERLESSNDAWIISEAPNSFEISEGICSSLMELVSRQNSEDNDDDEEDDDDDGLD